MTLWKNVGSLLLPLLAAPGLSLAQNVPIGAGSYTTALPAGAKAPQAQVYKSFGGPAPTHKFWTSKYWSPLGTLANGGGVYMFPHPFSMQTNSNGLRLGYFRGVSNNGNWFNQPFQGDLTLGVAGLNAGTVNVSATYDWAVDFNWGAMTARVGRGFPFIYVLTDGQKPTVTFGGQPTVFANNGNVLGVSIAGNNYGLFCPTGGTWSGIGSTTLTCNNPSGRNYFSLALLPDAQSLPTYTSYAFSFPTDTRVSWSYDPASSEVKTTYTVATRAMEGSQTGFLQALYPHQYATLSGTINTGYTYASPRGPMKVHSAASFSTIDKYHGVLPFLPPVGHDNATLRGYVNAVANEANPANGGESYGAGKQFNRVAQVLPLARAVNNTAAVDGLLGKLKSEMQNWLTASNGEASKLLYYDRNWGTLIGYPASYGSDTALSDHHFHYGYWIHAAALIGMFDPAWLTRSNWGGMIDLLRQDVANTDRASTSFPFLRHMDVYAGHSWASGEAPFGDGGNEESSSEAINAWVGLILYGAATNNTAVRDTGIWLYTQEVKATNYYWFNNGEVSTFPSGFNRVQVTNVFDAKSDTATWFGAEPEFAHGIQFLPFTGGSLYLGHDPGYVRENYNEILSLTGGTFNPGTTKWPDLIEQYLAFTDPVTALTQWSNTTFLFDGETKAHQYHWLKALGTLGEPDTSVTANTPLYAVFRKQGTGAKTHVAYNPTAAAITVNFTDGASFSVPPGSLKSELGTFNVSTGNSSDPGNPTTPPPTTPPPTTPDPPPTNPPPSTTPGAPIYINAGGGASGNWKADVNFSGGNVATTTNAINTSLTSPPVPPQAVYQSERWGPMTYTISGLTAGGTYTVQLHFAEFYWTNIGQRRFNVSINGRQLLTEFDIVAAAGGPNRASEQNLSATADGSGKITVQFTAGSVDQPKLSGLAVF